MWKLDSFELIRLAKKLLMPLTDMDQNNHHIETSNLSSHVHTFHKVDMNDDLQIENQTFHDHDHEYFFLCRNK